jgi:hypothetical protein
VTDIDRNGAPAAAAGDRGLCDELLSCESPIDRFSSNFQPTEPMVRSAAEEMRRRSGYSGYRRDHGELRGQASSPPPWCGTAKRREEEDDFTRKGKGFFFPSTRLYFPWVFLLYMVC